MNAKKWIILWGLFTSLFVGLTSCLDDDDDNNLVYVYTEPVIVKSPAGSTVMFHSQYGSIEAPGLNDKVKYGDYLLSWFYMDLDVKPYTATSVEYMKLGVDSVTTITGNGLTDDFTDSISDVKLYLNQSQNGFICVDSTFFAAIVPNTREENNYAFELLAHRDSINDGVPTFYLRAKKLTAQPKEENMWHNKSISYALNLSPWISQQVRLDMLRVITFNLKYKSGTDNKGKDVYTNYRHNPVTLKY